MGGGFHEMSGFVEKQIVFGSSLCSSRFSAAWAQGDRIGDDGFEHSVDKFGLLARVPGGGVDGRGPMAQSIEGTFKADTLQGDIMEVGGLLHEDAHEVVSNQMDLEFLANHVGPLAAQDIQTEDGFDLGEVEFDGPAPGKEFADGAGGIKRGISERGGEEH